VELLFNLLWLALSSTIVGCWLWSQHRWADKSLRSGTRMQIMALAVLILILLPVVSLTDDLQACTTPTEVEHLMRRSDLQHCADQSLHAVSMTEAVLLSLDEASRLQAHASLSPATEIVTSSEDYLKITANLPPPVA
jgi:hypothetical protein